MAFTLGKDKNGNAAYILIVDDNALMRGVLRRLLEESNLSICGEANDGLDGIEKAKQLRPSLIVLHFSMPRMNGLEAARKLKELIPDVPLVMFATTPVGRSRTRRWMLAFWMLALMS